MVSTNTYDPGCIWHISSETVVAQWAKRWSSDLAGFLSLSVCVCVFQFS